MNMAIIYIFLALSIDALLICIMININSLLKEYRRKNDLEQLQMNLNFKIDDSDLTLIDRLVEESFNRYCFLNYDKANKEYINSQVQQEMMQETLRMTLQRISPIYLNKLGFIYNKDYIEDIIFDKIQVVVIDYCVEVNGGLSE